MAENVIKLTITNDTGLELSYQSNWFNFGALSPKNSFPAQINSDPVTIQMEKSSSQPAHGCSGYVNYLINEGTITFAYSNPKAGTNKLGAGNDGKNVWDNMSSHDYNSFTEEFAIGDKVCKAVCICTGGDVNQANVTLTIV